MNTNHTQSGFTLVETLVAITVLLIAVTAPITIVVRSTQSSQFSGEQVVATFLAQEGLELAQKLRDDALLVYFDELLDAPPPPVSTPWAVFSNESGPYTHCYSSAGCGLYIDNDNSNTNGMVVVTDDDCAEGEECLLYFDNAGIGSPSLRTRYTHDGSGPNKTPTKYTRVVRFERLPMSNVPGDEANPEIRVVSTVTWRTGSLVADQRVVTQTSLLNLYDLP